MRVLSNKMGRKTTYAIVSGLLMGLACGVSAVGFFVASETFATVDGGTAKRILALTEPNPSSSGSPTSPLVGASGPQVAESASETAFESKEWVEVVDAVNMRSGASSANAVLKVHRAGVRLPVADRDGNWVKVVDPTTGEQGWIYGRYVKPLKRISRHAELTDE